MALCALVIDELSECEILLTLLLWSQLSCSSTNSRITGVWVNGRDSLP